MNRNLGIGLGIGCAVAPLVAALLGSLSCTSSAAPEADGGSAGGGPIIIGVSLPLTGSYSGTGVPLQLPTKVAETQLNSLGGVLGRHIHFDIQDDATDTSGVVPTNVLNGFLKEGVSGVLGPCTSSETLKVQNILFQAKVVEITPSATSSLITMSQPVDGTRFLFRTVPPDDFQGKAVAKLVAEGPMGSSDGGTVACKNLAIINANDGYGVPMASVVAMTFASKYGGSVVATVMVPTAAKASYQAEVQQVLTATPKPDCQVLIVYDPVADQYMRDFKAAVANTPVAPTFFTVGTDGIYDQAFIDNGHVTDSTSPLAVEGVVGTSPDTNPIKPEYDQFVQLYSAQYPLEAGVTSTPIYSSNEYDAAILIALAIEQAGTSTDGTAIRDAIFKVAGATGEAFGPAQLAEAFSAIKNGIPIHYNGASGQLVMGLDGNVAGGYIVWGVQGGQFQTLRRYTSNDLQ